MFKNGMFRPTCSFCLGITQAAPNAKNEPGFCGALALEKDAVHVLIVFFWSLYMYCSQRKKPTPTIGRSFLGS
jgi:hypothetical protein